ncbi:hypothetical protein [Nonomuraea sp. MG754425]|uniref:hypothetical protein n=1 Tax=Nonomuraea sp. MG754425 TaxID=2570319 RepID=UPI001F2774F5|nr:hypothetical protein [Nonomuraea sp. MG754425]
METRRDADAPDRADRGRLRLLTRRPAHDRRIGIDVLDPPLDVRLSTFGSIP